MKNTTEKSPNCISRVLATTMEAPLKEISALATDWLRFKRIKQRMSLEKKLRKIASEKDASGVENYSDCKLLDEKIKVNDN